jgi:hypothetical protein
MLTFWRSGVDGSRTVVTRNALILWNISIQVPQCENIEFLNGEEIFFVSSKKVNFSQQMAS